MSLLPIPAWRKSRGPHTTSWPNGQEVDYRVLDELVGEASGKGVLRAIRQKYGATAHEAIFAPILREIDREKPVPPRRRPAGYQDSADPLTASSW